jgi:hypothetical protein
MLYIVLAILGICTVLSQSVVAATRLGLHVTQEELTIWQTRAASGPYKTAGDVSTNSPGDWTVIVSNKESFRANPNRDFYGGGAWSVGSCISNSQMDNNANFPGYNNRTFGDSTRDAAFFAMVLPNDSTAADAASKVRTFLLTQAQTAAINFADKNTFCEGVVIGDANPRHDMALWMLKMLFAYDYLKIYGTISASDRAVLDPWFRAAGQYWRSMWFGASPSFNGHFEGAFPTAEAEFDSTVAVGGLYSSLDSSDNQCPMRGGNDAIDLYDGSPTVSDGFQEALNNRAMKQLAFVANVGAMHNDAELIRHVKMYVKTWLTYAVWPNGDDPELRRVYDTLTTDEDHGWAYSGAKLGSMVQIADVLARNGDMDLYNFSTSAGVCQINQSNAGGPKTIRKTLDTYAQYVDHTLARYVPGAPHDVAHQYDSVSQLGGGCGRIMESGSLALANHLYNSIYLKNIYLRQPTGGPINPPAYPSSICSGGAYDWGGPWGEFSGILFMFGQTEGVVDPYTLTGGSGDITSSLTLWWKFNGGSGLTAADSSSGGHLGTLGTSTAAPTWTTGCQLAGCLSFDGTADYVTTPDAADLDIVGDLTIAAWVKVTVATDATTVAQKEAGGSGSVPWLVEIENTGTPHWLWYQHMSGGNFDGYLVFTTHTIPTGTTWQHLAFVRTVATKTVALYVNGTLVQQLTYVNDLPEVNTAAVTVGGRPDNTARSLNGALDDVRIYARALSSEDVTALYQWTEQTLPTLPPPVALRLIR